MRRIEENPWTRTGSYYPPLTPPGYAYHVLGLGRMQEIDIDWLFWKVWSTGALLSPAMRGIPMGSWGEPPDVAAGDDENIFLSFGAPTPLTADTGMIFGFNSHNLVRLWDARVGICDMLDIYNDILHAVAPRYRGVLEDLGGARRVLRMHPSRWPTGLLEDFRELAEAAQDVLRFEGQDAIDLLRWLADPSDSFARDRGVALVTRAVEWSDRSGLTCPLETSAPTLREQILDAAEIIVPWKLPLTEASIVIFHGITFSLHDFEQLFVAPVGLPFHERPLTGDLPYQKGGFPYRCPICDGPVILGEWYRVLTVSPFESSIGPATCESCGGTFDPRKA